MTEREVDRLLERWVAGVFPTLQELEQLEELRTANPQRYRRVRELLPLMRRDASGVPVAAPESPSIVDDVMERLDATGELPRRDGAHSTRARGLARRAARAALLSATAAALLCAGVLIGVRLAAAGSTPSDSLIVRFELAAPEAHTVSLVGDFNEWQAETLVMREHDHDGVWTIAIPLRRGEVYTYNFLVDGRLWISDPSSLYRVKDGFGGEKSVLQL